MTKKPLVVDTNIISHALTQRDAYAALFKELEKQYTFAVTGYTKFELLCSSDKEHRRKTAEYLSQDMQYINLNEMLLDFAARVCCLYSLHKSTKGYKISPGDIVNAAYSIAKDCPILTIDNNDYPTPFFKEIDRKRVTYQSKKNRETTDTVYILTPDTENIKECFDKHKI